MKIGDKIAKARKAENLTQEQLADLLGVSRQAVSRWESDLAYPETDNLVRLSEILHVNCDYLLKDGVNENGEKIVEVKIVKEVPGRRRINFRFWIMLAMCFLGVYLTLVGIWNIVIALDKAVDGTRAEVIACFAICAAIGAAMLVTGIWLLVSCIKKKEYFFKRDVTE